MKLTLKHNLGVSLIFFPFRGEKTNGKINQCSLIISLDIIIIYCRCSIINGKIGISNGNRSVASFMFQKEPSCNVRFL